MTIIRNDRRQREAREYEAAASREASEEDEGVDLRWHPTQDELPNPISSERWEELLKDPSVFDEDGMHAVECLNDYGGPATLQQLSVRYRGTMGRYRKWLNGVAERAAKHEGRESMGTDQFGREEWWPYLYRQRIVGKAAANVYEMVLQPELQEALRKREEAKSAERKRQLEAEAEATRARNAEQRRARLEAAAKAQEAAKAQAAAREAEEKRRTQVAAQAAAQAQATSRPVPAAAAPQTPSRPVAGAEHAAAPAGRPGRGGVVLDLPETPQAQDEAPVAPEATGARAEAPVPARTATTVPSAPATTPLAADDALVAFLTTMEGIERGGRGKEAKARRVPGARSSQGKQASWRPLDYAHRYADRLADALELMAEGLPELTVARVARELGDESVEELAGYLNGNATPGFAYLRRLCDLLLVSEDRLEAPDSRAADLPVFCTLRERFGVAGAARRVWDGAREVVFLTDDSRDRRSGVIVRFSELSCGLLERLPVNADADRYSDPALSSYVRLVREIDSRAEAGTLTRSARKVSAKEWDALAAGLVWPGLFCA